MGDRRTVGAALVLAGRVFYGAGLLVAPQRIVGGWLGPEAGRPAAEVALRGLGAREVAVHSAALVALGRGRPLRPWLAASIAGDLADIGATFAARHGLPDGAAPKTLLVAGASAALSGAVAGAVDR